MVVAGMTMVHYAYLRKKDADDQIMTHRDHTRELADSLGVSTLKRSVQVSISEDWVLVEWYGD